MLIEIPDHIPFMNIITFAVQNGCALDASQLHQNRLIMVPAGKEQSQSLRLALEHIRNKQRAIGTNNDNAA